MKLLKKLVKKFQKPTNAEQVQILTVRRDDLLLKAKWALNGVPELDVMDADKVAEGKKTTQQSVRRRLASEISQIRKTVGRQRVQAKMFHDQSEVLSTDIHNLTLIQQSNSISDLNLDSETLAENAVAAEQIIEELADKHGMVDAVAFDDVSEVEQSIMDEFDEPVENEKEESRLREIRDDLAEIKDSDAPCTSKQRECLKSHNEFREGLTRREASDVITRVKENRAALARCVFDSTKNQLDIFPKSGRIRKQGDKNA